VPALAASLPTIPLLATASALGTFFAWEKDWALPIGAGIALAVWLLWCALVFWYFTTPGKASSRTYTEFEGRWAQVRHWLQQRKSRPTRVTPTRKRILDEVSTSESCIEEQLEQPGTQWVRATGYVTLGKRYMMQKNQ